MQRAHRAHRPQQNLTPSEVADRVRGGHINAIGRMARGEPPFTIMDEPPLTAMAARAMYRWGIMDRECGLTPRGKAVAALLQDRGALPGDPIRTCAVCKCRYTLAEWLDLEDRGRITDPGYPDVELRDCPCGNTMGREVRS